MSYYLPFIIGFFFILGLTIYFSFWYANKKTKDERNKILSGKKSFLAHWTYENINLADFQTKGSALKYYKKKLANVKEVYICSDGILIGDVIFYSWKRFAEFKRLEITNGNPACILFKIEYEIGDTESIAEFLIPIPAGKEQEAESVLNSLYSMVRFDY